MRIYTKIKKKKTNSKGTYLISNLLGYAHPSGNISDNVMLGRLGGLLAYKPLEPSEAVNSISKGTESNNYSIGFKYRPFDSHLTKTILCHPFNVKLNAFSSRHLPAHCWDAPEENWHLRR